MRALCSRARSAPPLSAENTTLSWVTLPLASAGHGGSGSAAAPAPPFHPAVCWVSFAICQQKALCFLSLQEGRSQFAQFTVVWEAGLPSSECVCIHHSVLWFVTQIIVPCSAQVPLSLCCLSHPWSVLQALGELNGARFLCCKSKPALGGCATQTVCTVLSAPVCSSGSVQDGCREITCGEFGTISFRKTPLCCLFSPWSVLRVF